MVNKETAGFLVIIPVVRLDSFSSVHTLLIKTELKIENVSGSR